MKPFLPKSDMPGWREISVVLPPQTINFYAWQDMLSQRKDNVSLKKAAAFFMWFWWHLSLSNLGYRNSFLVLYFFLILFVSIILVWYVEIPLPLLDGKASSFTWAGKVTNKTYSMLISMHGLHWLLKLLTFDLWSKLRTENPIDSFERITILNLAAFACPVGCTPDPFPSSANQRRLETQQ